MVSAQENVGILIDAWSLMAGRFPASEISQGEGVATIFAHVPLSFFNLSIPDRPLTNATELRGALRLAAARAKGCDYPSVIGLCEEWAPKKWESIAAEEGFELALNMTGMAAERLLPARRAAPELEFRRVGDEATARDIAMINAQAYRMTPESFECICNLNLWHEDSFGYVGYAGGRAVTSAAAVMRKAIERGREAMGERRIALHASDMGRPLYQSMGFTSGGKVVLLTAYEGVK